MRHERARTTRPTIAAIVALALLTGAVFLVARPDGSSSPGASSPGATPDGVPDSVDVTSSTRHRFTGLDELRTASDLVVSGDVVAAERGRVFGGISEGGTSSGQAVRSRVLTIEVDEVLASRDPALTDRAGTVVLVEEEGALLDGSPLVVDGAPPTRVGDRGIWFLVASGDPEFPGFAVVNSQGRYLRPGPGGDALRGADRSDTLVRTVEDMGATALARAVTGTPSASPSTPE